MTVTQYRSSIPDPQRASAFISLDICYAPEMLYLTVSQKSQLRLPYESKSGSTNQTGEHDVEVRVRSTPESKS